MTSRNTPPTEAETSALRARIAERNARCAAALAAKARAKARDRAMNRLANLRVDVSLALFADVVGMDDETRAYFGIKRLRS